jgi:peptidyl-prolyl cis-trans isomerase C
MNYSGLLLALLIASGLPLSACSGKSKQADANASQVAVKVNGGAITVAELNEKTGRSAGDPNHPVSAAMMGLLIDSELLRQAAIEDKLDADPGIHARIANSTRGILAAAYVEKQVASVGQPSEADISAYFNQHPERFSNRVRYDVQMLNIQPPPGKAEEIQTQADKGMKFGEFEQWLTKNNIPHTSNALSTTTGEIDRETSDKLMTVPVGGAVVVAGEGRMKLIFVMTRTPDALTLAQATPEIAFTLTNKRKNDVVENSLKQLRRKAKVEYLPPYTPN